MEDLAPCPATVRNLWKSSGIFGTLQKLSLSLEHTHISTFGKFGRFNLDLIILYKTLRLYNFWEPAVESILAFPFFYKWKKESKQYFLSYMWCIMNFQNKTVRGTLLAFTTTSHYSTHLSSSSKLSHPCFLQNTFKTWFIAMARKYPPASLLFLWLHWMYEDSVARTLW